MGTLRYSTSIVCLFMFRILVVMFCNCLVINIFTFSLCSLYFIYGIVTSQWRIQGWGRGPAPPPL